MTMFVSAKDFAVIQLVASGLRRFESTAILCKGAQGSFPARPCVRKALGLETSNKIQHFLRLGFGQGTYFVVNVFGRGHDRKFTARFSLCQTEAPHRRNFQEKLA